MDLSNYVNLQNRLKSLKGSSKIGELLLVAFFAVMAIMGVVSLIQGEIIAGLVLAGIGGIATFVFIRDTPKEKKAALESWSKLTAAELSHIDTESLSAPAFGNALVTSDAIVIKGAQGPHAYPARDILWVYGKQTNHKLYGVIPSGKTFEILFLNRDGKTVTMPAPNAHKNRKAQNPLSEDVAVILNVLRPKYPGIVFGYNQQVENLARRSIGELAALVDARNAGQQ